MKPAPKPSVSPLLARGSQCSDPPRPSSRPLLGRPSSPKWPRPRSPGCRGGEPGQGTVKAGQGQDTSDRVLPVLGHGLQPSPRQPGSPAVARGKETVPGAPRAHLRCRPHSCVRPPHSHPMAGDTDAAAAPSGPRGRAPKPRPLALGAPRLAELQSTERK